jgi:hypothetical protein
LIEKRFDLLSKRFDVTTYHGRREEQAGGVEQAGGAEAGGHREYGRARGRRRRRRHRQRRPGPRDPAASPPLRGLMLPLLLLLRREGAGEELREARGPGRPGGGAAAPRVGVGGEERGGERERAGAGVAGAREERLRRRARRQRQVRSRRRRRARGHGRRREGRER